MFFSGEYFEMEDLNLVNTDVRHGEHRHGGHKGEYFTGVTIFQRFMFITESCFEDLKSKYFQWEKRDL